MVTPPRGGALPLLIVHPLIGRALSCLTSSSGDIAGHSSLWGERFLYYLLFFSCGGHYRDSPSLLGALLVVSPRVGNTSSSNRSFFLGRSRRAFFSGRSHRTFFSMGSYRVSLLGAPLPLIAHFLLGGLIVLPLLRGFFSLSLLGVLSYLLSWEILLRLLSWGVLFCLIVGGTSSRERSCHVSSLGAPLSLIASLFQERSCRASSLGASLPTFVGIFFRLHLCISFTWVLNPVCISVSKLSSYRWCQLMLPLIK